MNAGHWDAYWSAGNTDSCFCAGKPVDLGFVWTPFFSALPAGARVLDLGCGAGAVARSAVTAGCGLSVVGIDCATTISPIAGVELVLGADIEAMPFSDGAFGAVVSQYGFEYADAARAAPEAARVLAKGGVLLLVVHAQEGPAVAAARVRLARLDRLMADDGIFRHMRRFGRALEQGRDGAALERSAVEAGRAAAASSDLDDTTRYALSTLEAILARRARHAPGHVLEQTEALWRELCGHRDRLADMTAAALNRPQAGALAERFDGRGVNTAPPAPVMAANGDLLAWRISGARGP